MSLWSGTPHWLAVRPDHVLLGASPHLHWHCRRQQMLCPSGLSPTACPEAWILSSREALPGVWKRSWLKCKGPEAGGLVLSVLLRASRMWFVEWGGGDKGGVGGGTERKTLELKQEEDQEGNEKVGGDWRQSLLIHSFATRQAWAPGIDPDSPEWGWHILCPCSSGFLGRHWWFPTVKLFQRWSWLLWELLENSSTAGNAEVYIISPGLSYILFFFISFPPLSSES